jgi:hypothetical protein
MSLDVQWSVDSTVDGIDFIVRIEYNFNDGVKKAANKFIKHYTVQSIIARMTRPDIPHEAYNDFLFFPIPNRSRRRCRSYQPPKPEGMGSYLPVCRLGFAQRIFSPAHRVTSRKFLVVDKAGFWSQLWTYTRLSEMAPEDRVDLQAKDFEMNVPVSMTEMKKLS